jgi:hypothetical protein
VGYITCGAELRDEYRGVAGLSLLGRMMLVALVIGTSMTVSATERVTLSLVVSGAIGWSFVPLLQLLTGVLLVRRFDARLLDRYFATHWAWSLWILAAGAVFLLLPETRRSTTWIALTASVPILWTIRLLLAFCREELGLDTRQRRRRVAVHQTMTYLLVLGYVSLAVALWPRILGLFA